MQFYEVTIKTTHDCADLIADILFSVGCNGVSINDKNDIADLYKSSVIWDYIDESLLLNTDETVYVKGIIGEEDKENTLSSINEGIEELRRNSVFETGSCEVTISGLNDEDWKNEWKKYYKPIVTSSVTVVPNWIKYHADDNEKLLWINPGMAFGTGEHETTKMCLDILGELDTNGKTVIDVGTGSGILGIASVLCGAKSAYMCDIDTTAIETARENASLNGVEKKVKIEVADLLSKTDLKADIVFANITADILIRLSKDIEKFINKGGYIILSGIIHARLDEVINAYKLQGFELVLPKKMGEWNALLFKCN